MNRKQRRPTKKQATEGSEWRIHWHGLYPVHSGFHDTFEGTNAEFEAYVLYMMDEVGWRHATIEHDANGRFDAWWDSASQSVKYSDEQ